MFSAKVVCDSVSPAGARLISVEATYPRFIHAEFMTHRDRARNAASSRAIPWKRKSRQACRVADMPPGSVPIGIDGLAHYDPEAAYHYWMPNCMYARVLTDPVVPVSFGREQKGMQSGDELAGADLDAARAIWLTARDRAVRAANDLAELGVHKSVCNRLTEPFMWITVLYTATEWKNFFRLRCHPAAEKHFQLIAGMIRDAIAASTPRTLAVGDWHLPYLRPEDDALIVLAAGAGDPIELAKRVSAGRCARLSFLTHDGVRDVLEDVRLCEQLINPRTAGLDDDVIHASPLEHVAQAAADRRYRSGPFYGWIQFRKDFPNENVEG